VTRERSGVVTAAGVVGGPADAVRLPTRRHHALMVPIARSDGVFGLSVVDRKLFLRRRLLALE